MSATQVDKMSLWQLSAQVEGYVEANTPKDKKKQKLSREEFDLISERL